MSKPTIPWADWRVLLFGDAVQAIDDAAITIFPIPIDIRTHVKTFVRNFYAKLYYVRVLHSNVND